MADTHPCTDERLFALRLTLSCLSSEFKRKRGFSADRGLLLFDALWKGVFLGLGVDAMIEGTQVCKSDHSLLEGVILQLKALFITRSITPHLLLLWL